MLVRLRSPGTDRTRTLRVLESGVWGPEGEAGEVDLEGFAVGGLADAHVHLAADQLELEPGDPVEIRRRAFAALGGGVFLVVDKGWTDAGVVATLTGLGPSDRPDFEAAAQMVSTKGGYYPGFGIETDAAGLADVVADQVGRGAGWVKLVGDWPRKGQGALANFDEESLTTAVRVAHKGGAKVAIHTMAPEVPSMAVAAGIDSIEHGLFLTETDLARLGERGGAWVPTILRMEEILEMLGSDSSGGRLLAQGLDNADQLLKIVPDGVSVLAGSDLATASSRIGAEAVALNRRGLDPERAARAATEGVYSYLGRPAGFEPGTPADAVLFARDPFADPSVLLEPAVIIRAGMRLR